MVNIIERVTPESCSDALPLLAAQFAEHGIALTGAELEQALAGLVDTEPEEPRGLVLVARDDGHPVGIAVLAYTWTLEHGGFVAWLDELYVIPERRGAGIGTELLEAALSHARAAGCRALDLEVDADHERVVSLYQRHGFERLGRARFAKRLR